MAGESPRPRQATGEPWRAQRQFVRLFSETAATAPIRDACGRLASADDAREARDRAVELFRIVVRVAACFALSSRAREATPLAGDDADAVRQLLRRGLTDGQWVGLLRRLSRHPRVREELPGLGRAFGTRSFSAAVDGLLAMRHKETVAHGAVGTLAEVVDVLDRRLPELTLVVETIASALSLVVPAADDLAVKIDEGRWFLLERGARSGEAVLVAMPDRDEVCCADRGAALVALLSDDDDEPCPYLGLRRFEREHAAVFFGREDEARRLARRIEASPFVTITGPSGAGKSSLVVAGVAPLLPSRELVTLRPGSSPLSSLAAALADVLVETGALVALEELFARSPQSASRAVAAHARSRGKRLLVVVDQAEELVTLAAPSARAVFAAALASLASGTDDVRVVMIVREDFFARVAAIGALLEVSTRAVEVVVDPEPAALVEMLTRPAALVGYVFDPPSFAVQVAEEIRVAKTPLPLLSFVGERLFAARDRRQKRITEATFAARGGVAAALTDHAERALLVLSPSERALARKMLVRLVTEEGTRAVVTAEELFAGTNGDPRAARVLARLAEARLVVSSEDARGEATYELVHEVLITEWPTLRDEIRREGARIALRAELGRAADSWERSGRSPDLLLRGAALSRFVDLGDLHDTALELLAASTSAETRARRVRRTAASGLAAVLLTTSVVLFAMVKSAERATDAARAAEERAASALRQSRRARYADRAEAKIAEGNPAEALAWLRAAHGQATLDRDDTAAKAIAERMLRLTLDGAAQRVLPGLDGASSVSMRRGVAQIAAGRRVITWDVALGSVATRFEAEDISQARLDGDGRADLLFASGRVSRESPQALAIGAGDRAWLGEREVVVADRARARLLSRETGLTMAESSSRAGTRAACIAASHAAIAQGSAALRMGPPDRRPTPIAELELDVVDLACADDGSTAIAGADRLVRLHDGRTVIASFTNDAPIARVAFGQDGKLLATATMDGHVIVRRRSGAIVARLQGPRAPVAMAIDAQMLVVVGPTEARAFDLAPRESLVTAHRDVVLGLDAGAGGGVLTWSKDKSVVEVDDDGVARTVATHPAALTTASVGPSWLLTGGRDREARLVDRRTGQLIGAIERHDGYVSATAIAEAHRLFATGAVDRRVRRGGFGPRASWTSPALTGAPFALVFSPDATKLGALLDDGSFVILGPSGAIARTMTAPTGMTEAHATAPALGLVTFGGNDGSLFVADVGAMRVVPAPPALDGQVVATAISGDGKVIAAADGAGVVKVAQLGDTTWPSVFAHGGPVTAIALSPSGDRVASVGEDGILRVVSVASGHVVGSWGHLPGRARAVAFAFDGHRAHVVAGNALFSVTFDENLDATTVFSRAGRASNLRMCDDEQRVAAVVPYPVGDAWRVTCPR